MLTPLAVTCFALVEVVQEGGRLRYGQHGGQARRLLGAGDFVEPGKGHTQHFAVEEEQGGQGLVLRGRRDIALQRQVRQDAFDLGLAQHGGMALAMKEDLAFNPTKICSLGA